jgi:hypothetical protein
MRHRLPAGIANSQDAEGTPPPALLQYPSPCAPSALPLLPARARARSLCAAYSLLGIDRCEGKTDDPEANLSPMATSSTQ